MSALHVVIRPQPEHAPSAALAPLYGLFDVVIDGVNVTAHIGQGEVLTLLPELANAVALLTSGQRARQTVQLNAAREVWELGLEADGTDVLLSVFRSRPTPIVAVYERRVPCNELIVALRAALDESEVSSSVVGRAQTPGRNGLTVARNTLAALQPSKTQSRLTTQKTLGPNGPKSFRLGLAGNFRIQSRDLPREESRLEKADLHALLVDGTLLFGLNGQKPQSVASQLFLDLERLVTLCTELAESWETGRPIFRRVLLTNALFSLRWGPDHTPLELRIKLCNAGSTHGRTTLVELDARAFCGSVIQCAFDLHDAFVESDPEQAKNLRLQALINQASTLKERLSDDPDDQTVTNPFPASYRCYAPRRGTRKKSLWDQGGTMRFVPRWVATVPNIDLAATFLCGDRLVVGSRRETACIDRQSGGILWRVSTPLARSVVSPSGLLRIEPNGHLTCHGLEDGEPRFELDIAPRPSAAPTGSVVDTAGLPKLFALAEGDRQVTALDLTSGEIRWRYTARRSAAFRLRRAGKLLLVAGGDPTLVALDIASGEVVWRLKQRAPFSGDLALDRDSIFALTGGAGGQWQLHHIEAWTGRVLWSTEIEDRPALGKPPLVTPESIVLPTRDDRGAGARGYDRHSGALRWEHPAGLTSAATAWLAVDDCIVANSAAGVLSCLDARTGAPRYNHVFSRNSEAEQPRRLEPVLRNGALFVPQHEVHVVRPKDGEIIGTLPSDLIPDLIRIDERCDVYIAEESGHLAAFGAAPRLTLVKRS